MDQDNKTHPEDPAQNETQEGLFRDPSFAKACCPGTEPNGCPQNLQVISTFSGLAGLWVGFGRGPGRDFGGGVAGVPQGCISRH